MEIQESKDHLQELYIEIKPLAESSVDIKPKVEDLEEMNEHVEIMPEFGGVTNSELVQIKTESKCEVKAEAAQVNINKNPRLESTFIMEDSQLDVRQDRKSLEQMIEDIVEECEDTVQDCEGLSAVKVKGTPATKVNPIRLYLYSLR